MPAILDRERPDVSELQAARLRKRFLDSGTLVINVIDPKGAGIAAWWRRRSRLFPATVGLLCSWVTGRHTATRDVGAASDFQSSKFVLEIPVI
jgi:hypothetical protein